METFTVVSCTTNELSFTNKAIINPSDSFSSFEHIAVRYPKKNEAFVFSVHTSASIEKGKIAFNASGRKWASLMTNSVIEAAPYKFEPQSQCLLTITFYIDFLTKQNSNASASFDTEEMARQFSQQFNNQAFTVGQLFGFAYDHLIPGQKQSKKVLFELRVKELGAVNIGNAGTSNVEIGLTTANTLIMFVRAEGSELQLTGGLTGEIAAPKLFNQSWDFETMGVGGLGEQFNKIFRRAFASRLLPPQFSESMGDQHVRGILLYGPPGTGKTLIARQISKMLLTREPKIVNGPEILNKYVGESEANIRKLFQDAEEEQAKSGIYSGLHMIIIDEIDAICKQRGNSAASSGVGDNVVNQLLTKIDGVNALNNVLLVGMTNRRDLIDEALLRPGRFEVQIEIGVPNKEGRLEILKIHTRRIAGVLENVSLDELAEKTRNYTGAELAGLVAAAKSLAYNRVVKPDKEITKDMLDSIKITKEDFLLAMKNDIKPALGASEDLLKELAKRMIIWDPVISSITSELSRIVRSLATSTKIGKQHPYYVLIKGEPGSGLTTVAANMAAETKFPFIRVYEADMSSDRMESAKVQHLRNMFDDASRSELSCIVIDDLDFILDYCHIGPRYSNTMRSVFMKKKNIRLAEGKRMLVICTCSEEQALVDMRITKVFNAVIKVPSLTQPDHVDRVLTELYDVGESTFTNNLRQDLVEALGSIPFKMGVKELEQLNSDATEVSPDEKVKTFLQSLHKLNLVIRHSRLDQPFM